MSRRAIRVAIVDDDSYVCRALARLLRASGFTVDGYVSVAALLASIDRSPPHCLVVDFKMPEMTGLELHSRLSRDGLRIPTILITAHGDETLFERARVAGILVCLEKPLQEASILAAVEAATGQP